MTRKQYFPTFGLILTTANITSTMCKQSYICTNIYVFICINLTYVTYP